MEWSRGMVWCGKWEDRGGEAWGEYSGMEWSMAW